MINLFRKKRADMSKKKKFFSYVLYALGEISLIVIGILLALYLQNRNEQKKTQESLSVSLNMLKNEIKTNFKKIDDVKEYHIMIRDTLGTIVIPKEAKGIQGALSFWKGMRTPRLQNAAFQTTIQSGTSKEINPKTLEILNGLYNYQDSYNDFTSRSAQIFFNADFTNVNSLAKTMASVRMTMNDLDFYERELSATYEYCLQQMDSIYPSLK